MFPYIFLGYAQFQAWVNDPNRKSTSPSVTCNMSCREARNYDARRRLLSGFALLISFICWRFIFQPEEIWNLTNFSFNSAPDLQSSSVGGSGNCKYNYVLRSNRQVSFQRVFSLKSSFFFTIFEQFIFTGKRKGQRKWGRRKVLISLFLLCITPQLGVNQKNMTVWISNHWSKLISFNLTIFEFRKKQIILIAKIDSGKNNWSETTCD